MAAPRSSSETNARRSAYSREEHEMLRGGTGFMRETPIERMSRDAWVQAIGGGAAEVMLEEVAKRLR